MKRIVVIFSYTVLFFIGTTSVFAQNDHQSNSKIDTGNLDEEDEGPIMYKFEPDYLSAIEKRREEIAETRKVLDTLDITEKKRRKLIRDLYKNGLTKRLSKVLLVENKYEENEN